MNIHLINKLRKLNNELYNCIREMESRRYYFEGRYIHKSLGDLIHKLKQESCGGKQKTHRPLLEKYKLKYKKKISGAAQSVLNHSRAIVSPRGHEFYVNGRGGEKHKIKLDKKYKALLEENKIAAGVTKMVIACHDIPQETDFQIRVAPVTYIKFIAFGYDSGQKEGYIAYFKNWCAIEDTKELAISTLKSKVAKSVVRKAK